MKTYTVQYHVLIEVKMAAETMDAVVKRAGLLDVHDVIQRGVAVDVHDFDVYEETGS
jgi:hypothetical protein